MSTRPADLGEGFRRDRRTIDPMDYYTPGPGKDASPMSTRLPHEVKHLINILVASKETPFQTPGEVLRAAAVWFLQEIVPRFKDGRLEEGLRHLNNYIDEAEHDALITNSRRVQKALEMKVASLISIGARFEAGQAYLRALKVASETSARFGQVMKAWAENAGTMAEARAAAKEWEIATSEPDLPQHKCADCAHRYDAHVIVVDDEGEEHVDCRKVKGGKKGACGCLKWQRERREVERG